jgi:hypothetical protein
MREALVGEHIGGHVQIVLADGVRAERSVAGYLAQLTSPVFDLNQARSRSTKLSRLMGVWQISAARAVISSKAGSAAVSRICRIAATVPGARAR